MDADAVKEIICEHVAHIVYCSNGGVYENVWASVLANIIHNARREVWSNIYDAVHDNVRRNAFSKICAHTSNEC